MNPNCFFSSYLMPVLSTLFEVLIILSQDPMDRVSEFAQKSLSTVLEENTLRREKFFESFKERLFHLLTSITAALNSISEFSIREFVVLKDKFFTFFIL